MSFPPVGNPSERRIGNRKKDSEHPSDGMTDGMTNNSYRSVGMEFADYFENEGR